MVTEVNDNLLVATAGWAKPDPNEPVSTGSYIRIGSVTKPFVATVTLHLVAQHRLTLDDTVARWGCQAARLSVSAAQAASDAQRCRQAEPGL